VAVTLARRVHYHATPRGLEEHTLRSRQTVNLGVLSLTIVFCFGCADEPLVVVGEAVPADSGEAEHGFGTDVGPGDFCGIVPTPAPEALPAARTFGASTAAVGVGAGVMLNAEISDEDRTVVIQLMFHARGPFADGLAPASIEFQGADSELLNCAYCARVTTNNPARAYIADAGTMDVTEIGAAGSVLTVTMTDVRFLPLTDTYDAVDSDGCPVVLESWTFTTPIQDAPTP
jgi:hypothetical protein